LILGGFHPGFSPMARGQEFELTGQKAAGIADAGDFEAFVDGIMAAHLKSNHIAGAAFAAVKDGQILLAKGYGYADVEKKKPVLADRTLFRPGSVSKLFTWTAVMQLVEQGKIDLRADVNTYLQDLKIPATFREPVTMAHLMSHTPGFEESALGMAVRKPEDLLPLGKFLAKRMPARVRPPGQLISYSNYGSALAGHIVELVAGRPFEEYIEENIFRPLGIEHSTFRQPLPAHLAGDMSTGYKFKNGLFEAQEFELLNGMAPAGGLSATAADLAVFMIAHLQNGFFGQSRILQDGTARLMHSRLFSHDPRLEGNAHGFWQWRYNNLDSIGHGGDTVLFHSDLTLIPEFHLGLFVSYNSAGGEGGARTELITSILDRYYPVFAAEPKPPADFRKRAGKFKGTYGMTRVNSSTFEKLGRLVMTLKVRATDKGTLLFSSGSGKSQWVEVEPLVFKRLGGQNTAVFVEDLAGKAVRLYLGQGAVAAYIRLRWFETPGFHLFLLIVCMLVLSSTLYWPLRALARRLCGTSVEERAAPRAARWLAFLAAWLSLIFLIGMAVQFTDYTKFLYGIPLAVRVLMIFLLLALGLGAGTLAYTLLAWIKGYWRSCARVHYTLVLLAFLGFVWFAYYWNILAYWF
jgi:CubicO group peptidase (beta-lactamase class C family)